MIDGISNKGFIMLKIDKIDFALEEAERFIARAIEWKQILVDDSMSIHGSKEGGACKRASMDLTRALSELRK